MSMTSSRGPHDLKELLDSLVEHTEDDARPVLYLKDDGEELQLQGEWDQREMLLTQQARHRDADARTRAEFEAWGCETDSTGAVTRSGGRSEDSAMGVGATKAGETRIAPFDPVSDEDWQAVSDLQADQRVVRQLVCVNGIEADELTLAEVGVEGLARRRSGHSSVGAWLW
ncbi:unnamed protein product [Ectocarpus sp. 12 AP-2014]